MFYGNGLACCLLNALVDDAEAPSYRGLLVQRRRPRTLGATLTAKLLEHLVLGGNIFVRHVVWVAVARCVHTKKCAVGCSSALERAGTLEVNKRPKQPGPERCYGEYSAERQSLRMHDDSLGASQQLDEESQQSGAFR